MVLQSCQIQAEEMDLIYAPRTTIREEANVNLHTKNKSQVQ